MSKKTTLTTILLSLIISISLLSFLNFSLFPPKISLQQTPQAQAATETIGLVRQDCTGYSNCFTSLSDWEANYGGIDFSGCTVGDLTCVDKIAVAQIDGVWTVSDTTAVAINGWTTDATRYIRIWTTEEARHDGKWNEGKYRLERSVSAAIEIAEDYVIVDGLQILQSSSAASYNRSFLVYNQNVSNEVTISNCILKAEASGTANNWDVIRVSDADLIIKFYNNIAYDWVNGTNTMNGFRNSGLSEAYLYNNTFVNIYSYGFSGGSGVIAKNNITQNCPNGFNGAFNASSDYNISDILGDTTGISSSYREGLVTDVSFVNESGDFHLASADTGAKDAGTNSVSPINFTDDIDGETRSGTWDIGADENGGTSQTCAEAGGICKTNQCSTYENCSSLSGIGCSGYCCSGACTTAAPDTESPTIPTNLSATAVSSSQINLSWTASTDNIGVTGYNIYRNVVLIDTSATNSYSDTGLSPSTLYTYTVSAYDAVPNTSGQSSSANATTDAFTGNVFYVLKGATGNGNGTSWIDAWDDLYDITGIQAGDMVYIGKGNSNYIGIYTFTANGTSEQNRIIIKRATISEHGSNTGWNDFYDDTVIIQPTSSGVIFTITDRQYITINGVDKTKFILSGDGAADYGIYSTIGGSTDTEYITISNLTIKNMDNNGINIRDYSSEIIIHDVEIYGCGTAGSGGEYANICCAYTSNSVPANCSLYDSIIHEPGNGVTVVDNLMGMSGFDIYNNIIYQDAMKSASADNLFITGSNIKIHDNLIYSANSDNSNQNIYIFTMSDGSTSPSHIRIYNNIIYKPLGAGGFGIYFRERDDDGGERGVVEDIDVFNNVIYGQEYPFFFREASSEGILDIVIENNIIRSGVTYEIYMDDSGMADDVITNYNYYYQDDCSSDRIMRTEGTYTLSQAQTAGREINGGCGNPQFDSIGISGFHLTDSSPFPVKDGGLTDPGVGLFSDDKDGISRPQGSAWDIGAYEYTSNNAHYVDNAATGVNNGTSWVNAWESFADINWGSVLPGDTIYISGGSVNKTYYETLNIGANGEEGKRITIQPGIDSGHNGTVIIDCEGLRWTAINLQERDYITIDGISGDAYSGDYDYGMKFINKAIGNGYIYALGSATHHIKITHIEFDGTGVGNGGDNYAGIRMGSSGGYATDIEVSRCWLHGNTNYDDENSSMLWGECAIIIFGNANDYTSRLIHHNKIEGFLHDGIKVGGGASIYNNYIADIEGSGHSDAVMMSSWGYCKIYNNFFDDCDDQNIFIDKIDAGTQEHIYIYNNVFDTNEGFGIVHKTEGADRYINNVHIYSNTFVSTAGPNFRDSQGRLSNMHVKNNLFVDNLYGGYDLLKFVDSDPFADGDALDYNAYGTTCSKCPSVVSLGGTYYTFAQLQAANKELHGIYQEPVFVNIANDDFSLDDTCHEAIRTGGVDLSSVTDHLGNPLFNTDFNGTTRTVWSMGAYEYISSQTCAEAGGVCQTNTCASYDNCSSLSGTCATGYCCSGVCSDPTIDTTPPTGSISINSSELTNSQTTSLSISATDPSTVTEMKISNTNNFNTAITEAYNTVKSWVLTAGDGLKTVYAWFKDSLGNWTSEANPITDTITLDETTPIISNIATSNITINSATISFTTSELTTSYLEYGLTTSYGTQTDSNMTGIMNYELGIMELSDDTTYNYRITSTDSANNTTQSTNQTFTTVEASTPDTTPPANITNLTADSITQTSVNLNWTSPGDDNNTGTASTYDLRYSTSNITNDTDFNNATQLSGEPIPQTAGTEQSLYIAVGLSPNTTYYFAIKTSDEVPNQSGLSNVVQITTLEESTPPAGGGGSGGGTYSDTTPPSNPDNFIATPADSQIFLTWYNPIDSDFVRVKVLRKENTPPVSHNDETSTIIYEGTNEEYTDINLNNNTIYYYAIFAYDQKPNYSEILTVSAQPEEGKTNIEVPNTNYPDGTLLKIPESFKVYIIINQKRKWIPTPEVFETLGYQWTNIIIITKSKLNRIPNYEDNLIRAINDYKVYLVVNGIQRHIPNPEIFLGYGFSWEDVVDVPQTTIDQYQRAYLIRESRQGKIYYLREDGIKKHIPNAEVFASYNNKWEDIQVISKKEMDSYVESNLIQLEGDNGIYLVEGGLKRYISSAEIFNRNGFKWESVVRVNETEYNCYERGKNL